MATITSTMWSGDFQPNEHTKARGREGMYAWYLQLKNGVLMVEIAEDPALEPSDLPLVGFGCGGWLYERKERHVISDKSEAIQYVEDNVQLVFSMFREKQLKYLPAVSCPCSDLGN